MISAESIFDNLTRSHDRSKEFIFMDESESTEASLDYVLAGKLQAVTASTSNSDWKSSRGHGRESVNPKRLAAQQDRLGSVLKSRRKDRQNEEAEFEAFPVDETVQIRKPKSKEVRGRGRGKEADRAMGRRSSSLGPMMKNVLKGIKLLSQQPEATEVQESIQNRRRSRSASPMRSVEASMCNKQVDKEVAAKEERARTQEKGATGSTGRSSSASGIRSVAAATTVASDDRRGRRRCKRGAQGSTERSRSASANRSLTVKESNVRSARRSMNTLTKQSDQEVPAPTKQSSARCLKMHRTNSDRRGGRRSLSPPRTLQRSPSSNRMASPRVATRQSSSRALKAQRTRSGGSRRSRSLSPPRNLERSPSSSRVVMASSSRGPQLKRMGTVPQLSAMESGMDDSSAGWNNFVIDRKNGALEQPGEEGWSAANATAFPQAMQTVSSVQREIQSCRRLTRRGLHDGGTKKKRAKSPVTTWHRRNTKAADKFSRALNAQRPTARDEDKKQKLKKPTSMPSLLHSPGSGRAELQERRNADFLHSSDSALPLDFLGRKVKRSNSKRALKTEGKTVSSPCKKNSSSTNILGALAKKKKKNGASSSRNKSPTRIRYLDDDNLVGVFSANPQFHSSDSAHRVGSSSSTPSLTKMTRTGSKNEALDSGLHTPSSSKKSSSTSGLDALSKKKRKTGSRSGLSSMNRKRDKSPTRSRKASNDPVRELRALAANSPKKLPSSSEDKAARLDELRAKLSTSLVVSQEPGVKVSVGPKAC
ncbi:expressed unknown protein [Seminavis robusta]|uniref:Uncharacterized protein n=1 Tax=Seminavis robusta TaxID=568900 RepID=A0A9N8DVQ1_9STRA|nr:expressed unknown protein [Seminavis robusta]|eukprot:Sro396_g134330.1 n/a (763) ;mRNA; r:46520-48808